MGELDSYKPEILKNVAWGKAQGLKQKEIAEKYRYNRNTVSKYSQRLREMNETQIKGLFSEIMEEKN